MAFNYTGGDGNYYVGDTGWHSDSGHKAEDPMRIKIAFYLDSLTGGAPCDPRKPLPPSLIVARIDYNRIFGRARSVGPSLGRTYRSPFLKPIPAISFCLIITQSMHRSVEGIAFGCLP